MEAEGLLNPDSEIHIFALHWSFLRPLQQQLSFFQEAWNHHTLRTEGNQSPYQLWTRYRDTDDPDMVSFKWKTLGINTLLKENWHSKLDLLQSFTQPLK